MHLRVCILKLLKALMQRGHPAVLQQLAQQRTLSTLQWITAHLPTTEELHDAGQLHLLLQAMPGAVGLSLQSACEAQSAQIEVSCTRVNERMIKCKLICSLPFVIPLCLAACTTAAAVDHRHSRRSLQQCRIGRGA